MNRLNLASLVLVMTLFPSLALARDALPFETLLDKSSSTLTEDLLPVRSPRELTPAVRRLFSRAELDRIDWTQRMLVVVSVPARQAGHRLVVTSVQRSPDKGTVSVRVRVDPPTGAAAQVRSRPLAVIEIDRQPASVRFERLYQALHLVSRVSLEVRGVTWLLVDSSGRVRVRSAGRGSLTAPEWERLRELLARMVHEGVHARIPRGQQLQRYQVAPLFRLRARTAASSETHRGRVGFAGAVLGPIVQHLLAIEQRIKSSPLVQLRGRVTSFSPAGPVALGPWLIQADGQGGVVRVPLLGSPLTQEDLILLNMEPVVISGRWHGQSFQVDRLLNPIKVDLGGALGVQTPGAARLFELSVAGRWWLQTSTPNASLGRGATTDVADVVVAERRLEGLLAELSRAFPIGRRVSGRGFLFVNPRNRYASRAILESLRAKTLAALRLRASSGAIDVPLGARVDVVAYRRAQREVRIRYQGTEGYVPLDAVDFAVGARPGRARRGLATSLSPAR